MYYQRKSLNITSGKTMGIISPLVVQFNLLSCPHVGLIYIQYTIQSVTSIKPRNPYKKGAWCVFP